jgi:hypothetical protein
VRPGTAGPLLAFALASAYAEAATVADCRGLQAALDASAAGEVVTLAEGLVCRGHFDLPSRPITLQGAGTGASLDGDAAEGQFQILAGTDVGATVIRNLTFRNGIAPFENGGAIHIVGDSPVTIESCRFFRNEATFAGGAVYVVHAPGPTFAGGIGASAAGPALRANVFGAAEASNVGEDGGAVYVSSQTTVELRGNAFAQNRAFARGGAASVLGCQQVTLDGDTFTANRILPLAPSFVPLRGGGLFVAPSCSATVFEARNVVLAGNAVESDGGEGGGVYAGGTSALTVRLVDATVVMNQADAGAAIAGGAADALSLHNAIVFANGGASEISGFASRDVRFSDACAGGTPLPGAGNICAAPALRNPPVDVHQLAGSPTIDAGSGALVPGDLATDMDGQKRVAGAAVDMGADERPRRPRATRPR